MLKKPTAAFIGAGWAAFAVFALTYLIALWRMGIPPIENYFYITILLFGLFGVVSIVKSIRDREDNIPVTGLFIGLSWVAAITPLVIMGLYLLNVSTLNELQRGLLFLTYAAAVFAAIVVQKNHRDLVDYHAYQRSLPPTGPPIPPMPAGPPPMPGQPS